MALWKIALVSLSILGGVAAYAGYQHYNACACGSDCPCGGDCPCDH